MSGITTTLADDILDAVLNGSASGTEVLGSTTYTFPEKCKFLSTLSNAATAGTEFTGGSYSAGGVSLSGLFTSAAAVGSKSNTGAISTTGSPATTWAGIEITDSTGTPKRMVFGPASSLAKSVNSGDTCTVLTSNLTGTLS